LPVKKVFWWQLFSRIVNEIIILPASQTVGTARIAPKIYPDQPPTMYLECSRFHPNRFTFGGIIAERVKTAILPHKLNPILVVSLASNRIIIFTLTLLLATKINYFYSNFVITILSSLYMPFTKKWFN